MRKLVILTALLFLVSAGQALAIKKVNYESVNKNVWRSIEFAGPIFGINPKRLHYRVSVEGGHGNWIPNRYGSGAGGWFQFMSGTLYGVVDKAFAEAKKRGYYIPPKFKSWYSPLGQSVAAAYMFWRGWECTSYGWAASC